MLELVRAEDSDKGRSLPMTMSYGGDTLNTSVYLSRNGMAVSYVTALGDDTMSDWLVDQWQSEGIDCSLVTRMHNSVPGMYMINLAEGGERSFLYWRKNSPASRLFDNAEQVAELFQSLNRYGHLYLSGISLAILPEASRQRLFERLVDYRRQGGKLIFDNNYRPNLWPTLAIARQAYIQMYQITDIALPTLEDEALLFGFDTAEQVLEAIRNKGVKEIIIKLGGEGCLAFYENAGDDSVKKYTNAAVVDPIDTTAAGDSFSAGYLSARLKGGAVIDACNAGHALASKVIQHRGAIIPV